MSVDIAQHEVFNPKVGKGGMKLLNLYGFNLVTNNTHIHIFSLPNHPQNVGSHFQCKDHTCFFFMHQYLPGP